MRGDRVSPADVLRARLASLALDFANGIADAIAEERGAPSALRKGPGTAKTSPRKRGPRGFAAPKGPVTEAARADAVASARARGIRLGG